MSRGKRYTAEQIIKILREVEIYSGQGQPIGQAVRACGISEQTYYRWRKEYGGISVDQAKRFKEIEKENLRLRKAVFCSRANGFKRNKPTLSRPYFFI